MQIKGQCRDGGVIPSEMQNEERQSVFKVKG